MTWWSPKSMRPEPVNPLFPTEEKTVVVKGLTPWQRQRLADGTPHTTPGPTALRPPDPVLYVRDELSKGSLVEKYAGEGKKSPKVDPQDAIGVIKSYLAQKDKEDETFIKKSQESTNKMNVALKALAKALDIEDKDAEDEEKSLTGTTPKNNPGQRAGSAAAGLVGSAAKTVLGSVPKR